MSVTSVIDSPTLGSNELDSTLMCNSGEYHVSETILRMGDAMPPNGLKTLWVPIAVMPLIWRCGSCLVDIRVRPALENPAFAWPGLLDDPPQVLRVCLRRAEVVSLKIVAILVRGFSWILMRSAGSEIIMASGCW